MGKYFLTIINPLLFQLSGYTVTEINYILQQVIITGMWRISTVLGLSGP